ncbi:hypothetical protein [Methylotenera sp. G11]|uniref:hypothetical protein n=1 Tax=Methylotenera sp. G11 TaxID=1506585 RepID=UPI001269C254|nr:hypothetical protein [Methylotenera sp. G11]
MGTSFVEICGNGFWMRDSILELFLRLAALHIEDQVETDSIAHKIRDEWLLASRGYFNGSVPLSLESNTASPKGKVIVLSAIDSLLHALRKSPPLFWTEVLSISWVLAANSQPTLRLLASLRSERRLLPLSTVRGLVARIAQLSCQVA